ncbi:unnamed protein product [Cunninghamella blakesleeana]
MSRLLKFRGSFKPLRLNNLSQRTIITTSRAMTNNNTKANTIATANCRLNTTAQWFQPKRQAEVLTRKNLGVRDIILNRPKKLNALNLAMVRAMIPELQSWEKSDLAKVIVIKSEPGNAFCAGGDVKTVVDLAHEGKLDEAAKFFEEEYQLDHFISTLSTPFISIMDGITMGGGVGLSVHAPFRIATENTLFAMPETKIGFLPEVGGSFFLSRLDGQLGPYLGLTGKRLKGVDVLYAGIATHYVPSSRLPALEARLAELENPTHDMVNNAIDEFAGELDESTDVFSLGGVVRQAIDQSFKHDKLSDIIETVTKLSQDASEENAAVTAWAKETLKYLNAMSPTSLKVTLQQIRSGATLSIGQCFKMEYHLVQKFLVDHDFREGVYTTLVERNRKPEWKPATLDQTSDTDIVANYFNAASPLSLELLTNKDYKQYPHRKYMLPSEDDIKAVVTGEAPDVGNYALSRQEIVDYIVRDRNGKQGVKQKVSEVLQRKTKVLNDEGNALKWIY